MLCELYSYHGYNVGQDTLYCFDVMMNPTRNSSVRSLSYKMIIRIYGLTVILIVQ